MFIKFCVFFKDFKIYFESAPRTVKRRMGSQKDSKRIQRDGKTIAEGQPFAIRLISVCYPSAIRAGFRLLALVPSVRMLVCMRHLSRCQFLVVWPLDGTMVTRMIWQSSEKNKENLVNSLCMTSTNTFICGSISCFRSHSISVIFATWFKGTDRFACWEFA